MSDWYPPEPFFTPPRDRKTFVAHELARLITPDNSDPPLVAQRKAAEAKERLRRQDLLFGTYWGETLGVPWSAGDPEGDADAG